MPRTVQQLSVSVPADLVEWLDGKARELGSSRSGALAALLEARRRQEWEELFAQGCREFAGEMQETAELTRAAQAEVALREPFDAD
jgi:hypothetical protein